MGLVVSEGSHIAINDESRSGPEDDEMQILSPGYKKQFRVGIIQFVEKNIQQASDEIALRVFQK